ncbi:MAG: hpt [Clostridia bacterium]|jgi:hypoxanthine phosphoribosyltransferase|nr:hpt [Clostridia bacterium]
MNEKILFTEKEINDNLDILAKRIDMYISILPKDEQNKVIVIGLLTGCIHFVSDLTRKLESDHKLAFIKASSYLNNKRGDLTIDMNITSVKNHHVIVLDDICDSGITLNSVVNKLSEDTPLSIKTCVLVNKLIPNKQHLPDFKAFDVEDVFIYGYGLDYDEYKRNLKNIRIKIY